MKTPTFKTAAVTGATGHLGNVIVRQLLEQGVQVRALVLPGDDRPALAGLNTDIHEADITQPLSLKRAFENCEVVFHAAGLIRLDKHSLPQMQAVNVGGTCNVLEAAIAQGVRRLVYTSSIHAFASEGLDTIDETAPIDPARTFSDYSRTKAEATLLVRSAAMTGLNTVILYPVGICGPFDFLQSELTKFITDFRRGRRHIIPTGGYFFIDVRDAARAHIVAAGSAPRGGEYIINHSYQRTSDLVAYLQQPSHPTRVFFVSPGLAVWAGRVARLLGAKNEGRFVLGEHAAHELRQRYKISSARADSALGPANISIQQSFTEAAAWLEHHATGSLLPARLAA